MTVAEERVASSVFNALRSISAEDLVRALRAPSPAVKSRNLEIIERLMQRVFTAEKIAAAAASVRLDQQQLTLAKQIERQEK